MTLISVLVALLVERFLGHLQDLRRFDAFVDFSGWLRRRFFQSRPWDGAFGVLVVLAVPVVITGALQGWLSSWLFGLPELVFSIAVLIYCLGPRDLAADAESYQDAAGGAEVADREVVHRRRHQADVDDVEAGGGEGGPVVSFSLPAEVPAVASTG